VTVGVGDGLAVLDGVGVGIRMTVGLGLGLADGVALFDVDAEGEAEPLATAAGGVANGLNGLRPAGPLYAAGTTTGAWAEATPSAELTTAARGCPLTMGAAWFDVPPPARKTK
jgi:hypothetical protein